MGVGRPAVDTILADAWVCLYHPENGIMSFDTTSPQIMLQHVFIYVNYIYIYMHSIYIYIDTYVYIHMYTYICI